MFVLGICLAVWLLFDAVNLQKAAQASPVGARRTVSLDLIGPVALFSRYTGFAEVDRGIDALLGRRPGILPEAGGSERQVLRPRVVLRQLSGGMVALARYGNWPSSAGRAIASAGKSEEASGLLQPSAAAPLRVLVIGDSVGENMGQSLSNSLLSTGMVTVDLDTHSATGLARPDYFNWPAEVSMDVASFHPQVTIAMFGGNDGQGFEENGQVYSFGTPAWQQAYSSRVSEIMTSVTSGGGSLIWAGMPPMADPTLNLEMGLLNSIYADQVAHHPRSTFLPTNSVLGGAGGSYAAYLPDGSGQPQQVRQDDGVHLTLFGSQVLALYVQSQMEKVLGVKIGGA